MGTSLSAPALQTSRALPPGTARIGSGRLAGLLDGVIVTAVALLVLAAAIATALLAPLLPALGGRDRRRPAQRRQPPAA